MELTSKNLTFIIVSFKSEKVKFNCLNSLPKDFKKIVRTEDWKKKFLSKSIKERITLANSLRKESSLENKKKSSEIMDVNIESLNKIVGKYKADIVIHGHVHKPKIHQEIFGKRYVLGDWDENLWYVGIRENEFYLEKEKI